MPKPVIVVIGSINMDLVSDVARLPKPGETISGGELALIPGGKGANQAVAASRLGGEVHMVGRVGSDAFGPVLRDGLERNGVDVRYVKRSPGASGTATILVQDGGENSIVLAPGANGQVSKADVDAALPLLRRADAVLLQLEIPLPTVIHAIKRCRKLGVRTILDPGPAPKTLPPAELLKVDVISPNETEAAALVKDGDDSRSLCKALLKAGAKNVVLKLGAAGSLHADKSLVLTAVRSFKIKPVDTTAAGDSFTAGLAVALSQARTWPDALRFANAAGALACTVYGAQPSLPKRAAVLKLLEA